MKSKPGKKNISQDSALDRSGSQPFAMARKVSVGAKPVFKKACLTRFSKKPMTSTDTLPTINGIEQLSEPLKGSKPFTKVYYQDQADELVETATALPVRENHFIAPIKGWPKRIFRKPTEAKP